MPTGFTRPDRPDRPAAPARGRVLAAALMLAAALQAASAQGVIVGRVVHVQDGDSVVVQQNEHRVVVRLAGIDAPELSQAYGREAREQLTACSSGRVVVVETQGTDRHGRVLGILEANHVDCGLAQLRAGLAWHYRSYADEQSLERRHQYTTAEREARQRRLGLWQQADPLPPWRFRHGRADTEQASRP